MTDSLKNDLFIRACKRLPVERTPIWVMRQAGRYLPEYRAVRKKSDFLTMCKTPELVAEVTLQPIDLMGVDAAIIFSDILVIPEAMGMHLEMYEGRGPVFPAPIRNENDVDLLKIIQPDLDLQYVLDAIELTKKELNQRVPLIGFSGSPWTLLCYMVEGQGSKNFAKVKSLIYKMPKLAHKLLDKISNAVVDYLCAQIDSGVDAVQIFDTWGGILSIQDFETYSLQYIKKILAAVSHKKVPKIFFAKGIHFSFEALAQCGADVIGLDWSMNIGDIRQRIGDRVALQGNMDPTILYGSQERIKQEALSILKSFGHGSGHVFNLGHGILPDIPPENLKFLVETLKTESPFFHAEAKET